MKAGIYIAKRRVMIGRTTYVPGATIPKTVVGSIPDRNLKSLIHLGWIIREDDGIPQKKTTTNSTFKGGKGSGKNKPVAKRLSNDVDV